MKQVTSKTEFQTVTFPFTNSISIESSYETITDTANLIIPKKINFRDENGDNVENIASGENAVFKRGDTVKISLGYDHSLETRFNGFIAGVRTKFPLEFSLEDETYFLKQNSITLALKNPTLTELMDQVIPDGINYTIHAKFNLGDFRITKASTAEILNELRKKHGIYSWFRDGVLNIGLAVVPGLQNVVRFTMFKDIIDANNLQFINDFDRELKVVAKSIKDDNTELTATAGDKSGETRTVYFYNIESIEDLQKIADSKVGQLKYSGYEGDFLVFGDRFVNHGDIVEIVNPQIPEQSGAYICDKVVTECGMDGVRQSISIKQKVYDLIKNTSGEWIGDK
tara:strand:+ start:576 stop:1595 length:1020 start_codon:yes stop_codon:yes gene_type:complete